jgi:hypothetical protein
MIIPLIIGGHTSCADRTTIIDVRGHKADVINNVISSKKNNPNLNFYTIYSVDSSIQDSKYERFFDKVLYSKDVPHSYIGEKIKVETALNYLLQQNEFEWDCFIKSTSRAVLTNVENYVADIGASYDFIGQHHQTSVQYHTAMFIGSKRTAHAWIDCEPKMNVALTVSDPRDWGRMFGVTLLENLFYSSCKRHKVRPLIIRDLYGCVYIQ